MTTKTSTPVDELIDRLAGLEPADVPLVSLYLDTRPNDVGRPAYDSFLRKELRGRVDSFPVRSLERESLEADAERIQTYVRDELDRSANTLALFACSASGLFEAVALEATLGENRVYVGRVPHLYPLARLADQYRRYAALVTDSHSARIFVFGLGRELQHASVENPKMRRTSVGGWSQMRYQRHVDQQHLRHAKDTAEALERVVREEAIEHVVIAADEALRPLLRSELSKDVQEKVIDMVNLDIRTPEHEILAATLESFRRHDAASDAEVVARLVDEYRGAGLGVVGVHDTLAGLESGQVEELVLTASPAGLDRTADSKGDPPEPLTAEELARREALAGDLVARAHRTSATVRFIEDVNAMWDVGGVGAFLRYRLTSDGPAVPPVDVPEPEPLS